MSRINTRHILKNAKTRKCKVSASSMGTFETCCYKAFRMPLLTAPTTQRASYVNKWRENFWLYILASVFVSARLVLTYTCNSQSGWKQSPSVNVDLHGVHSTKIRLGGYVIRKKINMRVTRYMRSHDANNRLQHQKCSGALLVNGKRGDRRTLHGMGRGWVSMRPYWSRAYRIIWHKLIVA